MLVSALAKLTVIAVVLMLDISATALVLLSLITQNGVLGSVWLQLSVIDETLDPLTIEPRTFVDPAVIDEHPVPHVGNPPVGLANSPAILKTSVDNVPVPDTDREQLPALLPVPPMQIVFDVPDAAVVTADDTPIRMLFVPVVRVVLPTLYPRIVLLPPVVIRPALLPTIVF